MYDVGEVVLMEWQGWLKAFKVVEVIAVDAAIGEYDYKLEMLDEHSDSPGWIRPGS